MQINIVDKFYKATISFNLTFFNFVMKGGDGEISIIHD